MINTVSDNHRLQDLAIGSSAGDGPFISENSVTRISEGQSLAGASAAPASIWQNDVGPYQGSKLLNFGFAIRRQAAFGAGDEAFVGLAGDKAAVASLDQAIGIHLNAADNILAMIATASGITEVDTGFTLGSSWREVFVDLYTGIATMGPPDLSVGGLGQVLFSVADDAGQLRPVARNQRFDMSAFAASFFQWLATCESTGTADIEVKYLAAQYRE